MVAKESPQNTWCLFLFKKKCINEYSKSIDFIFTVDLCVHDQALTIVNIIFTDAVGWINQIVLRAPLRLVLALGSVCIDLYMKEINEYYF